MASENQQTPGTEPAQEQPKTLGRGARLRAKISQFFNHSPKTTPRKRKLSPNTFRMPEIEEFFRNYPRIDDYTNPDYDIIRIDNYNPVYNNFIEALPDPGILQIHIQEWLAMWFDVGLSRRTGTRPLPPGFDYRTSYTTGRLQEQFKGDILWEATSEELFEALEPARM
jgi:hypothetical protein